MIKRLKYSYINIDKCLIGYICALVKKLIGLGHWCWMDLIKIENNFIKAGYDFQKFENHVKNTVEISMDADGDLLPPWLKYSGMHPRKIFWRMGQGEDYITIFDMWRLSLTEGEILRYIDKYPNLGEWNIFCLTRHRKWIKTDSHS